MKVSRRFLRSTSVLSLAASIGLTAGACGGDDGPDLPENDAPAGGAIRVDADIEADTTFETGNTYELTTNVFVRGATLTIEPGVTILGDRNSSLVIASSARIQAEGTAEQPIVFTSSQPEGARASGDWGGVVLLGLAPINVEGGSDSIEGFPAGTAGTEYGGAEAGHDCGVMQFVRIEFAGFELSPDNELNGLTVGACGSQTQLSFIQIHKGADDGVEFFGGTAGITNLVVTQPDDDGLDWDFGWSGDAQFVIVQQNAAVGNNGFESDNNVNNNDASPRSAPEIWNATLIGSDSDPGLAGKTQAAMLLRRGTAGVMSNLVIEHFTDMAIDVADFATVQQAQQTPPALVVDSSMFFDNANDDLDGWPADFDGAGTDENDCETPGVNCLDERAFFTDPERQNEVGTDPQLGDPLNLAEPDFAPQAGSPALTGGATPPAGFDQTATFRGAIGDDDWTAGWTAYPAN